MKTQTLFKPETSNTEQGFFEKIKSVAKDFLNNLGGSGNFDIEYVQGRLNDQQTEKEQNNIPLMKFKKE